MLKLYADETVDAASSLMQVAGYLMTEGQAASLDEAVSVVRGELPYFHMREGHYWKHPDIYCRMVDLIQPDSVICGLSVSLYLNEYEHLASLKSEYTRGHPLSYWCGSAYTYALGHMMDHCSDWLEQSPYREETVDYILESHPNQGDANTFWGMLSEKRFADRRKQLRYASHSFVNGKGPLGSVLQVCDVLAWNLNKMQREKSKSPELNRLFRTQTFYRHHGPKEIAEAFHGSLDYWEHFDKNGRRR